MNYNINTLKNDLICNDELFKGIDKTKISVLNNNKDSKLIYFSNLKLKNKLKHVLVDEIVYFLKKLGIKKSAHILVVGIGNDNYTVDSVGPKVLKHIKINAYLEIMGYKLNDTKVSALEPGVLGETGILTGKTIKSVVKEIKPHLVIVVDSLVSDNMSYINKCIQITDDGLNSVSGIKELEIDVNKKTLGVPVLLIGVTTALLAKFANDNDNRQYVLSAKDIDKYVSDISLIIGESINRAIRKLG